MRGGMARGIDYGRMICFTLGVFGSVFNDGNMV